MSRQRLFCSRRQLKEGLFTISGDETHHAVNVLRLKSGNKIFVFTEQGSEFLCEIVSVRKGRLSARILEKMENQVESPISVTLIQALPKAAKMEQIIVHGTELGLTRLIPVISQYSITKGERRERWRRMALEATKQCGRRSIPQIEPIERLESLDLDQFQDSLKLIAAEPPCKSSLKEQIENNRGVSSVTVVIGPEGGFAAHELEQLQEAGFNAVSMGPRILRTQTAPLAMLAVIQYELGDWVSGST